MAGFVTAEPVLERVVDDALQPVPQRRVDADPSLEQALDADPAAQELELAEDARDRRRRDRPRGAPRRDRDGALPGGAELVRGQRARMRHEREHLVPPRARALEARR